MTDSAADCARLIMRHNPEDRYRVLNEQINRYAQHPLGSRERAMALDFNARLVTAIRVLCMNERLNPPWLHKAEAA